MRTKYLLTSVAAAAALVLTACGTNTADSAATTSITTTTGTQAMGAMTSNMSEQMSGQPSGQMSMAPTASSAMPSISDVFNDADVTFTTGMVPHHMQAVEMAEMVADRSDNPEVIALAAQIKAAQQPEIDLMLAFLSTWGQQPPGHEMGHEMGMMSDADMASLMGLSGAEFDKMWLTMMTAHHQGAIEMANVELTDGSNPQAKELATHIIAAQQVEIDTMAALLK